tara:strand:- start:10431 stop:10745 length:315 start_codon:yes stop_codon:yes gene_type:complete
MTAKLIYVTAGSAAEAETIASQVVEERLAACANILGAATSIYWWEDKLTKDSETVFILKTTAELVDQAVAKILALHSYDCPAVVVLDIEKGNPEFLNWIDKNTL